MADRTKIAPGNVDGDFFVDTTCISCGNCRDLAPNNFSKIAPYYIVSKQPENQSELDEVLNALVCCPEGSIGAISSQAKQGIAAAIKRYPEEIENGVFYLGFNSPDSYGGKSYFIKSQSGNWMVDSPKFSSRLISFIKEHGGLKYIFLTHRDDVAEASAYAAEFGASRIIHKADLEAQKDAEIVIDGIDLFEPVPGFKIIPTPGHTMGHCMLLYLDKILFSGDVFTSHTYHGEDIETWPPYYCWWSWDEQTKSIERLTSYSFQMMLPSHGRRFSGTCDQSASALRKVIERCKNEKDPDPQSLERARSFAGIAQWAKATGQNAYALFTEEKSKDIMLKLKQKK